MSWSTKGSGSVCNSCGYYFPQRFISIDCPQCKQTELMKEQNRILQRQQYAANGGGGSSYSGGGNGSGALIGGIFAIGAVAFIGYLVYTFLIWLWELTVAVVTWIWNVVTWPFRFTWHSFENVIIGTTNLVGFNHDPAWWETSILLAIILTPGFYLIGTSSDNDGQSNKKPNSRNLIIAIFLLAIVVVLACGIWVKPAIKAETSIAPTITSEQKTEAPLQEQSQPAPVATAPVEAPKPQLAPAPVVDNTPFAPSFDCAKASNNAEKMICGDRELSKLDVQLSQLYSAARSKAVDKDKLKSEQIAWVKSSRTCPDVACLNKAFQDRIKQLSN